MSRPSAAAPAEAEYLTTADLARLLRKKAATVRQMRHRGSGPRGTRIGRDVLYARRDVDDWLRAKSDSDEVGRRTEH